MRLKIQEKQQVIRDSLKHVKTARALITTMFSKLRLTVRMGTTWRRWDRRNLRKSKSTPFARFCGTILAVMKHLNNVPKESDWFKVFYVTLTRIPKLQRSHCISNLVLQLVY
ncbi:hypothetical protein L3Y34_005978 [Caenorhabditis briggsae]|uniref:Uncharacterized protein n=1 Tax=Caenorhabditis briggsae TaxID=6238 RepID=A0AAE9A000_CAEBR|nr:hypothetical protein L3Y34_005978 [Caenorhabditis briggsae]